MTTNIIIALITFVVAGAIGLFCGMLIRKKIAEAEIGSAELEAKRIVDEGQKLAETKKKEALIEAKEEILKIKNEADREIKERRNEVSRLERRCVTREETLDKKIESATARSKESTSVNIQGKGDIVLE